jgi:putative ATP-dependent endonuclease of the OLD family
VHIQSVTIAGFRSFGPAPQKIDLLNDLTAVVGPNASGKTALLQALCKMFGVSRAQRTIHRSDFHLPAGVNFSHSWSPLSDRWRLVGIIFSTSR